MYAVVQDQGGREYMEDTCIAEPRFFQSMDLYAIFDGHGGSYVSEFLRDHLKRVLLEELRKNASSTDDVLYNTIKRLQHMLDPNAAQHTGSTCLIAVRNGETWTVANVGDCRAITNNGPKALRVTNDHKPGAPREFNRIKEAKGFVSFYPNDAPRVNGTLAVSRSLGDLSQSPWVRWEPEVSSFKITPRNPMLIMASDGIWDTMEDQEALDTTINTIMTETKGHVQEAVLKLAAQKCLHIARNKGSSDNVTIMIIVSASER